MQSEIYPGYAGPRRPAVPDLRSWAVRIKRVAMPWASEKGLAVFLLFRQRRPEPSGSISASWSECPILEMKLQCHLCETLPSLNPDDTQSTSPFTHIILTKIQVRRIWGLFLLPTVKYKLQDKVLFTFASLCPWQGLAYSRYFTSI